LLKLKRAELNQPIWHIGAGQHGDAQIRRRNSIVLIGTGRAAVHHLLTMPLPAQLARCGYALCYQMRARWYVSHQVHYPSMLPTPERIRAARLGAALQGLAAAGIVAAIAWVSLPDHLGWLSVVLAAGVVALVWWWCLRPWRRRQIVVAAGLSEGDSDYLRRKVSMYRRQDSQQQARFRDLVCVFLAEVRIVGVGCKPTRHDQLLAAASAIVPIFGFPAWEYDGLQQVLLRPMAFDARFGDNDQDPLLASGLAAESGMFNGTVILSLPDLRDGFAHLDGDNVGIHEFAHLVDKATGLIDGLPPGMSRAIAAPWVSLVRSSLKGRSRRRVLRRYGYTNPAEFFAVGSELFFEDPSRMRREAPELHELMTKIYHQRPASRTRLLPLPKPKVDES
jgi:Mlc titration factor MtfA (ptsG expression regulator)